MVVGQSIVQPNAESPGIIDRDIKINFIAKVDDLLEWEFKTLQQSVTLKLGENQIIKYEGKNLSNKKITSTADFFASPDSIHPYIIKTECFCFKEQTLNPGESKIFTMVFFVDPSMDSVEKLKDLKELVPGIKIFGIEDHVYPLKKSMKDIDIDMRLTCRLLTTLKV